MNALLNCANPNRNLYQRFKEEMVMEGTLKWRHHENELEICIMTDYNAVNGNIIPGSFVHVTKQGDGTGSYFISCTCDIYKHLKGIAYENEMNHNDDIVLDTTFTCMHCRYFCEKLMGAVASLQEQNTNLSWALNQVHLSMQYINDPIQLIGNVIPQGTTKFSVKTTDNFCSMVLISFNQNKCFATCTNGMCHAQMQNRKKVPKSATLQNTANLCGHLQTMGEHLDCVKSFFPEHFNSEEGNVLVRSEVQEEQNNDDIGIGKTKQEGTFNLETGLWNYPSLSDHKPTEMMDQNLVNHTQIRNQCASCGLPDTESGLNLYILKPSSDTTTANCECGSQYTYEEDSYELVNTAVLYTCLAALKCMCYNLKCQNKNCTIPYDKEAQHRGIFFYTAKTAIGDEVALDFINAVQKTKTSFCRFCTEMTRKYQTNQVAAYPFLTGNTFIGYFFGWLSAFKIDFRKEIDPICKHDPKVLACDGTHIGVSVKHMELDHPVTEPELKEVVKPIHKCGNRVLVYNNEACRHLKYITQKLLGKLKPNEVLPFEVEERRKQELLQEIHNMNHIELTSFIDFYLDETQDHEVTIGIAHVMQMFCGDASISSALTFRSHDILCMILDSVENNSSVGPGFEEMKKYNKEIANLVLISVWNECSDVIVCFLRYLIKRIEHVHSDNRPVPLINEIPNSYDPHQGVVYYFTESGNQLRKMRVCDIPGNHKGNFDDQPPVDAPCTKNYPGVSFGGYGYLFLWFCPVHGHSYGFHLIAGGEGRKDPFSSLFKYKPTVPDEVFYDNACQLNEYCLNREPGYFLSM